MGVCLPINSLRHSKKTPLTGSFLKRKIQEYEKLKQEIEFLTQETQTVEVTKVAKAVAGIHKKIASMLNLGGVNG